MSELPAGESAAPEQSDSQTPSSEETEQAPVELGTPTDASPADSPVNPQLLDDLTE